MMRRCFRRGCRHRLFWLAGGAVSAVLAQPAKATDEIQVYNAAIAAVGQFTIQQHLNYTAIGLKNPPFPGGPASNPAITGPSEFPYGLPPWCAGLPYNPSPRHAHPFPSSPPNPTPSSYSPP